MMTAKDIILTGDAASFLQQLTREFRGRLKELLDSRRQRQTFYDEGYLPNFDIETKAIRDSSWTVAKIPECLLDRRVEITGPAGDRKMVINALNSGANVFMADFEDSLSPAWENILRGQINLKHVVDRSISFRHPKKGFYQLNKNIATLFVRPRGLHMKESHFKVDGLSIPASLFDFGLFMFHNAKTMSANGSGPYFYLPKIEHYQEAAWWNDVFNWAQDYLEISRGTIRATVLIETLPAAFQMNEILWELKDHSAGLNCGRWDYIFSCIKTLRNHSDSVFPDRSQVTMNTHFMKSYAQLLVQTCHRRGVHAMGGMAAQIPIRGDEEANSMALEKVRQDKLREAQMGHDGTWVAHPGLIETARDVFDEIMPEPNQINNTPHSHLISQDDLIKIPSGTVTTEGLSKNIKVSIQYMAAWLAGNGCVPLDNLMEDAATAEISRVQIWQWLKNHAMLDDEKHLNLGILRQLISLVMFSIKQDVGEDFFEKSKYEEAQIILEKSILSSDLPNFLTLMAYDHLIQDTAHEL